MAGSCRAPSAALPRHEAGGLGSGTGVAAWVPLCRVGGGAACGCQLLLHTAMHAVQQQRWLHSSMCSNVTALTADIAATPTRFLPQEGQQGGAGAEQPWAGAGAGAQWAGEEWAAGEGEDDSMDAVLTRLLSAPAHLDCMEIGGLH